MLEIREKSVNDFRMYRYEFLKAVLNYMQASTEMDTKIEELVDLMDSSHLTRQCFLLENNVVTSALGKQVVLTAISKINCQHFSTLVKADVGML